MDVSYVRCLYAGRHEGLSLDVGKRYRVAPPDPEDEPDEIRIIDNEGEDYLYPRRWFEPAAAPTPARGRTRKKKTTPRATGRRRRW